MGFLKFRIFLIPMKYQSTSRNFKGVLEEMLAGIFLAGAFFIGPASRAQGEAPESALFSCISNSVGGGPQALDSLITRFEAELVSEGLLEDTDGEGYEGLLQRIASGQGIVRAPELYFGPRFRSLPRYSIALQRCRGILDASANNPGESTLARFEILREAYLHENLDPAMEALAYLELLSTKDLDLPYYRLFTYELIDRQAFITASPGLGYNTLPSTGQFDTRGANVFRVYLNERNQLIIADQLVSEEQMLKLVTEHARTFEQSSLYIIEMEPDVKYNQFIAVKDQIALAISQVRDNYSRVILGKTLTELTPSEEAAVFGKFPIRIVLP